jgi:microcystin-dependent protein
VSSRVGGRTAAHRLSVAEMPSHSHNVITSTGNNWDQRGSGLGHVTDPRFGAQTSLTGGNQPHSHAAGSLSVSSAFRGGELDLRVRYLDVIVAVKD